MDYNDKISFTANWSDYDSGLAKNFILNFYPSDNTIDIFDIDYKRYFMKRLKVESITRTDLYLGSTLRIYGRQIQITGYANASTKKSVHVEHTMLLLKPLIKDDKYGEIISILEEQDYKIHRMRMCKVNRAEALDFYQNLRGEAFCSFLIEHLVSGTFIAVELVAENCVKKLLELLGPANPEEARKTVPNSLRAIYGHERTTNGLHASTDEQLALKDASLVFPTNKPPPKCTAVYSNCTLCIIKPHVVKEKKLGKLLKYITDSHFKITALEMFYLSDVNADEFLEVYKGLVHDYHEFVKSYLDGPCVALEISGKTPDMNVYKDFRELCGPSNPLVAKQIRPNSIRAKFGCAKFKNAVHCTDVEQDTMFELEYFFKILRV